MTPDEAAILGESETMWASFSGGMVEFPGDWERDARVCLVARSPRPCTALALVLDVDTQA